MPTRLARPKLGRRSVNDPANIGVYLVDLLEIDPPTGQKPLHWRLLTTTKVDDVLTALSIADLYRRRWAIEQLFRTMKTQGFDIESIHIDGSEPRDKLITAALIAAVAVQQLVHARDGGQQPLRPMTDVFYADDWPILQAFCRILEGKTQKQKIHP